MYGIQSQERRYHYSGIAVPVCWNGGAIPAGIFTIDTLFLFEAILSAFPMADSKDMFLILTTLQ